MISGGIKKALYASNAKVEVKSERLINKSREGKVKGDRKKKTPIMGVRMESGGEEEMQQEER